MNNFKVQGDWNLIDENSKENILAFSLSISTHGDAIHASKIAVSELKKEAKKNNWEFLQADFYLIKRTEPDDEMQKGDVNE